jgi:hypothetical protein
MGAAARTLSFSPAASIMLVQAAILQPDPQYGHIRCVRARRLRRSNAQRQ